MRLEWLCVCLLRVSAGACYILGAPSGSGVGAPPSAHLPTEVKMDEMATVMNA